MSGLIDILNLEPTSVSRDLQGKYILVYGQPKTLGIVKYSL